MMYNIKIILLQKVQLKFLFHLPMGDIDLLHVYPSSKVQVIDSKDVRQSCIHKCSWP